MTPTDKKSKPIRIGKKPFKSPVLQRYGAVRNLTENVGSMGAIDGGSNPKIKTT